MHDELLEEQLLLIIRPGPYVVLSQEGCRRIGHQRISVGEDLEPELALGDQLRRTLRNEARSLCAVK
jgi:hypothetical protein